MPLMTAPSTPAAGGVSARGVPRKSAATAAGSEHSGNSGGTNSSVASMATSARPSTTTTAATRQPLSSRARAPERVAARPRAHRVQHSPIVSPSVSPHRAPLHHHATTSITPKQNGAEDIAEAMLPEALPSESAGEAAPGIALANSSESSFLMPGLARIVDLHPEEKSKIGKLLQEIVALKKAGFQREAREAELQQSLQHMQQAKEDAEQRREEYDQSMRLIQEYQRKLAKHDAQDALAASTMQRHERRKHDGSPRGSDNATVNRLHELSARARVAATSSPFDNGHSFAASHHSTSGTAPHHTTITVPSALPPFTSVLSSLASSPYRPPPMPASISLAFDSHQGSQQESDDERPRSTIPRPAPGAQPSPTRSSSLQEIRRAFKGGLSEARRSLSPRRRLDLDSAVSSPSRQAPQPLSSSFRVSSESRIHPRSPRQAAPVLHSAESAPGGSAMPPHIALLPTAVSGITRALAASSPEQIERRALQLAQEMYEKRLKEEEERVTRPPTLLRSYRLARGEEEPQESDSSESIIAAPPARQSAPSLSSFFHSHPLTSHLSPIKQRRGEERVTPNKQRSGRKKQREVRSPAVVPSSTSPPRASSGGPTNAPSNLASTVLNKSLQLAQSFAEERRARSVSLQASGGRRSSVSAAADVLVPDSPYAQILTASQDTISMTPTTRKIHRLLAIQNPELAATQQQDKEERALRLKEESRLNELHERRRQELAVAESRAKQSQEIRTRTSTTNGATERTSEPSVAIQSATARGVPPRHLLPPQHTVRAKSPIDTYVPPPFSYRTSSRASTYSTTEVAQRVDTSHSDLQSLSKTPAAPSTLTSPAPSTWSRTPGSASDVLPHTHTSFTSPYPTSRSHASTLDDDEHQAADAEILDLFNLRSPASLQQQIAQSDDEDGRQRQPHRDQQGVFAAELKHAQTHRQQLQESYATNFASAMLESAPSSRPQPRSSLGLAAAPFTYSAPYPTTRVATQAAAVPSLQTKIDKLHMLQLERELEDVLPHVLQELASGPPRTSSINAAPSARLTHDIDAQRFSHGSTSRLAQPSSPIAVRSRHERERARDTGSRVHLATAAAPGSTTGTDADESFEDCIELINQLDQRDLQP